MYLYLSLHVAAQPINDPEILKTRTMKGAKNFVVINGNKMEVFTRNQRYNNRLFYEGVQIKDEAILKTYTREKNGKHVLHSVVIEEKKVQVFTAAQIDKYRLLYHDSIVDDEAILRTHTMEGKRHYLIINGQKVEVIQEKKVSVSKSGQEQANLPKHLFLNGAEIVDPEILATYKKEGQQYYLTFGKKTIEVYNTRERSFFKSRDIRIDPNDPDTYTQDTPEFDVFPMNALTENPPPESQCRCPNTAYASFLEELSDAVLTETDALLASVFAQPNTILEEALSECVEAPTQNPGASVTQRFFPHGDNTLGKHGRARYSVNAEEDIPPAKKHPLDNGPI